jgi:hypothetical protein
MMVKFETLMGTVFVVCILAFFACLIGMGVQYQRGFEDGQIAAINGNIQYELKDQPPVWVKKND